MSMRLAATAILIVLSPPGQASFAASEIARSDSAVVTNQVLDVPFVAQRERLCGGASLAMVLRHWGARGVRAEDFALYADDRGITVEEMVESARRMGYEAHAFSGDEDVMRHHIERGRPVIALIDAARDRSHYVVVVGWGSETVTFHDPARRPFVTRSVEDFSRSWTRMGRWALLVTPLSTEPCPPGAEDHNRIVPDSSRRHTDACEREIEHAIALSQSGRLTAATADLERIALRYPSRPEPRRELAGIYFRQRQWHESACAAERALAKDPHDAHSWHLLGASRFMLKERDEALDAWNAIGAPTVDLVRIDGLERTRYQAVADALGVEANDVLTAESVQRARRRLELVPSVAAGRIDYRPNGAGSVELEVSLVERSPWRPDWTGVGVAGVRTLIERTVSLSVPSPTGGGEVWEASYRWWERRPRTEVALMTPQFLGLHGNIRLEVAAETQTYAVHDAPSPRIAQETSREAKLALRQWVSPDWLYEASTGFHRIQERGDFVSLGHAVEWRSSNDRRIARAGVSVWPRVDRSEELITAVDVQIRTRWEIGAPRFDVETRVGWSGAGTGGEAPRALWSGAGTGEGRPGLLRAHPLIQSGVIDSPAFAPSLAVANVELTRWIGSLAHIAGVAVFIDAASITGSRSGVAGSGSFADAGIGLRLRPPGQWGELRLDLAIGLADEGRAISLRWQPPWRNANR